LKKKTVKEIVVHLKDLALTAISAVMALTNLQLAILQDANALVKNNIKKVEVNKTK